MIREQIRDAAIAVVNGGIGFVPLPSYCRSSAAKALATLVKLGEYRRSMGGAWKDEQWGYEVDDKGQFDKGLSQWREDEQKDVFHFDLQTAQMLRELGASVNDWNHFFSPCDTMYRRMQAVAFECAQAFDSVLPGYNFLESCSLAAQNDMNRARLLAYQRREQGVAETAFSHRDRDFITLSSIWETAPGLFIGHDKETRIRISTPPGHAVIFAGRKFEQMTDGKVKALYHGTCEVPELEPHGRRAAVFFFHTNVPLIREPGELKQEPQQELEVA